jgi:hypothetical protein
MPTGPKTGWGGKREGSGAPTKSITAKQAEKLITAAEKFTNEQGVSPYDLLMQYAYGIEKGQEFPASSKLKALEKYFDLTMARLSEGGETDKNLGPQTFLPEERPDNVVDING